MFTCSMKKKQRLEVSFLRFQGLRVSCFRVSGFKGIILLGFQGLRVSFFRVSRFEGIICFCVSGLKCIMF